MDERCGNPSLPKTAPKNLLYRNPLHVPAPANLRLARLKCSNYSNSTNQPDKPNAG